ncbi:MAG: DUF3422 family protein [Paracoccus sp. (in: a-proteobacteria)]|nr:DUF3422 family protein [Paracoccus sp. (in: a-proteobacteria)]
MDTHENSPPDGATVYGMAAHGCRAAAVDAIHARPHLLIEPPRVLTQLVFMHDGDRAQDHATMAEMAGRFGLSAPDQDGPFHGLTWDQGKLHCEKHIEFSTYLWSAAPDPRTGDPMGEDPFRDGFTPPGPVFCGIRLDVLPWTAENARRVDRFDPISLCRSVVENGKAQIATDFHQDAQGLTRILVLDRGLSPARLGALIQRLLEIETYRVLALLGGPIARALVPRIRKMEQRLAAITEEMRTSARSDSENLLSDLTDLSAEMEADSVAILYRFSASRSYYEIVEERLAELDEAPAPGCTSWRNFLHRRLAPMMRTCRSVEKRLADLSQKVGDAVALLSSWIDVQLEHQNSDLLKTMNDRARMQLRLQQTVEGLSVAAVSYYITSLLGYFIRGIPGLDEVIEPYFAVTLMIPFVVLLIWWTVRRIRLSHSEGRH